MAPVDWVIVVVITVSTLISIMRGFVREAMSLATWVIAFLVARMFGHHLASLLVDHISLPSLRLGVAFGGLFIITLILGGLVNRLIVELVRVSGLTGADRFFGMGFGMARGLLIIVVLTAVLRISPVVEDAWWKESLLIPHFQVVEEWLKQHLVSEEALLNAEEQLTPDAFLD